MAKIKTLKTAKFLAYLLVGTFLFYINAAEISYSQSPSPERFIQEGKSLFEKGDYEHSLQKLIQAEVYFKSVQDESKAERLAEIYFFQGLNFARQKKEKISKALFKRALRYSTEREYDTCLMDEATKKKFTEAKMEFEKETYPKAMGMPGDGDGGGGGSTSWIVLAVLALAAVGVLAYLLLKGKEEKEVEEEKGEIVFIYYEYSIANSYKSFLDSKNLSTDLVNINDIADTDFTGYKLIIIGPQTGDPGSGNWRKPGSTSTVDGSGKPIIGLGKGGSKFFYHIIHDEWPADHLYFYMGWPHTWSGVYNKIYAIYISHPIYKTPNSISIPDNRILQLYSSDQPGCAVYMPTIPSAVTAFARQWNDTTHYHIVRENFRHAHRSYLLWGIGGSPNEMTDVGKQLFENVVNFMKL